MQPLFTIGHSTHQWDDFADLLYRHSVQAIADVRSHPYSSRMAQFNRETMERALKENGIRYVFLGEELGARRAERDCYVCGVARYERIAATPAFAGGLARVVDGGERFRVALLCAERDPLECHRTILVCRHLRSKADIYHILADGSLEAQDAVEERLMDEEGVPREDLFTSHDKLVALAYERRGERIAYHECSDTTGAEVYG